MSNCIKEAVTAAIQAVRTVNRDYYVGLLSGAVWAHSSVDERGSGTRGFYEEFTDGHADTLNWLDDGLFDFVLVKDYGSTNLSTANFNTVLDWWNQVAKERQLPLYIAHAPTGSVPATPAGRARISSPGNTFPARALPNGRAASTPPWRR